MDDHTDAQKMKNITWETRESHINAMITLVRITKAKDCWMSFTDVRYSLMHLFACPKPFLKCPC